MKNFLLLIAFLAIFHSTKAQSTTEKIFSKSYHIEVGGKILGELLLEENNVSGYSAAIRYPFFKGKPALSRSFVGRLFHNSNRKKTTDTITVVNKLPDSVAKDLVLRLREKGIEEIKPCKEDTACAKIDFIDPDYTVFVLTTDGKSKYLEYAGIGYPATQFPEKTKLRRKVQELVSVCIAKIDYSKEFKMAQEKLIKGWYFLPTKQGYLTFKR